MDFKNAANQAERPTTDANGSLGKIAIVLALALGIAAFFFYRYLLDHVYSGDPFYYQNYYDHLLGRDLVSAMIMQRDYLGSSELIYPIVAWIGSNAGVERNLLMSVFDGLMYAIAFAALMKYKSNYIFIILLLSNFYFLVLSTSAERLKFSYIILLFALLMVGRTRAVFLAIAPLAHFQTFITEVALLIWYFSGRLSLRTKVLTVIAVGITTLTIFYFFSNALISKFSSYQGSHGIIDILPSLLVLILSMLVFRNKASALFAILPLVILVLILGGERINMITVTIFIYLALAERRTGHPLILIIMAYFSIKSIGYVHNIILYGNGFVTG